MEPWKVLRTRVLVDRPWLKVHEQAVKLPNGGELEAFHLLESPDWTGVLAVTSDGQVVLVEQYRHGFGGLTLELPAGVVEASEAPLAAAQRELLEETGYAAERWSELVTVACEPSRNTNRAHFFVAQGAQKVAEPSFDASEELRVCQVAPAELLAALGTRIVHGVHVGAILLAARGGWLQG